MKNSEGPKWASDDSRCDSHEPSDPGRTGSCALTRQAQGTLGDTLRAWNTWARRGPVSHGGFRTFVSAPRLPLA